MLPSQQLGAVHVVYAGDASFEMLVNSFLLKGRGGLNISHPEVRSGACKRPYTGSLLAPWRVAKWALEPTRN